MPIAITRREVIMPGAVELTQEAGQHLALDPSTSVLSVACGTGELELYLAATYGCRITGIDSDERFVRRAQEKAATRALSSLVSFDLGDGKRVLPFEDSSFDVVFCSGAICEFFHNGLREFHRILRPGGRCAIIEVVWHDSDTPAEVVQRWTEGTAVVLTLSGNCEAFESQGFRAVHTRQYHEPGWWEAYYEDRGTSPRWIAERDAYRRDQPHLDVGLFVFEKR